MKTEKNPHKSVPKTNDGFVGFSMDPEFLPGLSPGLFCDFPGLPDVGITLSALQKYNQSSK